MSCVRMRILGFNTGLMMNETLHTALRQAIGAHFSWQLHLKSGIDHGKAPMPVDQASACDCCDFGKWLAAPEQKAALGESVQFRVIDRLHREFHLCAGRVVEQIALGDLEAAYRLLETEFKPQSEHLVAGLSKWLREAGRGEAA